MCAHAHVCNVFIAFSLTWSFSCSLSLSLSPDIAWSRVAVNTSQNLFGHITGQRWIDIKGKDGDEVTSPGRQDLNSG